MSSHATDLSVYAKYSFSSSYSMLAGLRNYIRAICKKKCGKVAHGPRKEPLDFSGNPDHFALG